MHVPKRLLPVALLVALSCPATAQVAILQILMIEGEGAVHAPGARSTRPMTVEVTDETGKPVEGASVSFHLPEEGAGGSFPNGLRTAVAITDARGRASVHGLQANRVAGRFQVRILVSKEQVRAGIVSFQYVGEPASAAARTAPHPAARPKPARTVPQPIVVPTPAEARTAPELASGSETATARTAPQPANGSETAAAGMPPRPASGSETVTTRTAPRRAAKPNWLSRKWVMIAAAVGGAAAAGLVAARSGRSTTAPPSAPLPQPTIGVPTIVVGHP